MNKNKKIQISKSMAKRILLVLKNENCFDGFISRLYTKAKCINYFQECANKYFKYNDQLINWNKESWFDIFDDNDLSDAIVFYMQDFNLNKELEKDEEQNNSKSKQYEKRRKLSL